MADINDLQIELDSLLGHVLLFRTVLCAAAQFCVPLFFQPGWECIHLHKPALLCQLCQCRNLFVLLTFMLIMWWCIVTFPAENQTHNLSSSDFCNLFATEVDFTYFAE